MRYNVRDYGATGDGATDDAAAIQVAINTAPATAGAVWNDGQWANVQNLIAQMGLKPVSL